MSRSDSLIATFDRKLVAGGRDRGKHKSVSRLDLTAADLAGARRREPAAVTRVYTAYAPPCSASS